MSSKFSLVLKSSGFRVLQTLVGIVIGLLMMPFLIQTLGKELYGLWIVIGSIVGTYYLLDLGFNQAVTRYVSKYIHQNNPDAANRIINTALVIYSILGVLVFLASIVAAYFGAESLMQNSEQLTLAQTILVIVGFSIALEFPAKAFPGIISAYMRYDYIAKIRMLKSVVDALCIYLLVSNGYGLISMALITLVTGLISTILFIRFSLGLFKGMQFDQKLIDLSTIKEVFHFSKWVFITDFSTMLREKMDIWFVAFYLGNIALTVYYVAIRLVEYAIQFLMQATGITGPIFTELYAKNENNKLKDAVMLFLKLDVALGLVAFSGFCILGSSFIDVWMKGAVPTNESFLCLLILIVGRLSIYFTSPINSLLMTLKKHHVISWLSIIEIIISALLCVLIIPVYGIYGAAVAMTVPLIVSRLITLPFLVKRYVELELFELLVRFSLVVVVHAVFLTFVYVEWIKGNSLDLTFIILGAPVVMVCSLVISFFLFNRQEIGLLKKKFTKNGFLNKVG